MKSLSIILVVIFIFFNPRTTLAFSTEDEENPKYILFHAKEIIINNKPASIKFFRPDNTEGLTEFKIELVYSDSSKEIKTFSIAPDNVEFLTEKIFNAVKKLNNFPFCFEKNDSNIIDSIKEKNFNSAENLEWLTKQKDEFEAALQKIANCNQKSIGSELELDLLQIAKKVDTIDSQLALEIKESLESNKMKVKFQNENIEDEVKKMIRKELFTAHMKYNLNLNEEFIAARLTCSTEAPLYFKTNRWIVKSNNIPYTKNYHKNIDTLDKERVKTRKKIDALKTKPADRVKILKAEVELEGEMLYNVKIICRMKLDDGERDVIFHNYIPTAFSRKVDVAFDRKATREKYRLYAPKWVAEKLGLKPFQVPYILLPDVLQNNYELHSKTENYSAADTTISLKPNDEEKIVYKEKLSNVLSARVYSDFMGINEENPNGLIQTEISKRMYLWPATFSLARRSYFHMGFFNSVRPKIIISKLEEHNKELIPDSTYIVPFSIDSTALGSISYFTNPFSLYRYSRLESGGELNVFYAKLPKFHLNFYFNVGGFVRLTDIQIPYIKNDSVELQNDFPNLDDNRTFTLNTLWIYPEFVVDILPHPSYRASFNAKFLTQTILNKHMPLKERQTKKGIKQAGYIMDPFYIVSDMISLKFEAAIRINRNKNSEMFFRTYYNFIPFESTDFFQAQLGYSFNIFKKAN